MSTLMRLGEGKNPNSLCGQARIPTLWMRRFRPCIRARSASTMIKAPAKPNLLPTTAAAHRLTSELAWRASCYRGVCRNFPASELLHGTLIASRTRADGPCSSIRRTSDHQTHRRSSNLRCDSDPFAHFRSIHAPEDLRSVGSMPGFPSSAAAT